MVIKESSTHIRWRTVGLPICGSRGFRFFVMTGDEEMERRCSDILTVRLKRCKFAHEIFRPTFSFRLSGSIIGQEPDKSGPAVTRSAYQQSQKRSRRKGTHHYGQGPSLADVIARHGRELSQAVTMALNFAANAEEFKSLRPDSISWPIHIFLPGEPMTLMSKGYIHVSIRLSTGQ